MLYTLSHSPYLIDLNALLRNVNQGDVIVLVQDGVTAALSGGHYGNLLINSGALVYALLPDLLARGMSERILSEIKAINYTEFIDITVTHTPQMAW